jgi:hypothetical protein
MAEGWIKLHRKVLGSGLLRNRELAVFWIWCLLKASHSNVKTVVGFTDVDLQRGQFIFGRRMATKELGLTDQTVRTCVKNLVANRNITIKSTSKFSILTVVNYDSYQDDGSDANQQTNQQLTSNQPASNQQEARKRPKTDENLCTPRARAPAKQVVEECKETTRGGCTGADPPLKPPLPEETVSIARNVMGLTPEAALESLRIDYPDNWIMAALKAAALTGKGKHSAGYVRGILQRYAKQGGPDEPNDSSGTRRNFASPGNRTNQPTDYSDVVTGQKLA